MKESSQQPIHEQGPEYRKERPPFDSIILMTYGSYVYRGGRQSHIDPNYALSYESKMAALAAAEAVKEGLGEKIIVFSEKTVFNQKAEVPPPTPKTNSGSLIKEYLISRDVPEDKIEIHTFFNNTVEQVRGTVELEKAGKIRNALVISLGFHESRVKENFRQIANRESGAKESFMQAEELLKRRDRRYKPIIERWANSPDMQKILRMEKLFLRPLTYIDRGGHFQEFLTKRRGIRPPLTQFPRQRRRRGKTTLE